MANQPHRLSGLTPRESALDAYYRMAWAFDCNDWELFASAWARSSGDVAFHIDEFGQHNHGLNQIKTKLFDVVAGLDTQHIATNARVHIELGAKTGRMWMMALNQHFRKTQGSQPNTPRLWGGNRYTFDIVEEEDGVWKIKEWWVEMGWHEGDLAIVGK